MEKLVGLREGIPRKDTKEVNNRLCIGKHALGLVAGSHGFSGLRNII